MVRVLSEVLLPALLTALANTSLCRAADVKGLPKPTLVPPRMRRENSFICAFREHLTGASSVLGPVALGRRHLRGSLL